MREEAKNNPRRRELPIKIPLMPEAATSVAT
jgi:hypothetical protein